MKKILLYAATATLLASCANDEIIDNGGKDAQEMPISFQVGQKNMTRTDKTLQETGHYNFGVWAYKNTDVTNAVMDNYLVGYMDNGTVKKGYYMTAANQTTLDDDSSTTEDGKSMWAYEKMGRSQYDYTGTDGFYTSSQDKYKSNNPNQWLKYWDLSSANTEFFAYAPYIYGTNLTPSFNNNTKVMTFKNNSLVAGYDDVSLSEYMYAYNKVLKSNYKKDVPLEFKRMNSKINIKFYEVVDGYSVKILDLQGNTNNTATGVQATPATAPTSGTTYSRSSDFYIKASASVNFSVTIPTLTITRTAESATTSTDNLVFASPTANAIGTTSGDATESTTTYYGIPLESGNNTGFTFHVSYELKALDTDETITVNNATVYVPASSVQWKPNTHYTYIFKITKNSTGTTDGAVPTDESYKNPTPSTEDALYPIVFDGCTVVDWIENPATEHPIN